MTTLQLPPWVGRTPLLEATKLASELGLGALLVKDEGAQRLGTWQARGMAAAAIGHSARGITALSAPCTGSDAAALASACRTLRVACRVVLPTGAAPIHRAEARLLGARVIAVLGDHGTAQDWLLGHPWAGLDDSAHQDLTPFGEPFRLEGEATLAREILADESPDALVIPTGSGLEIAGAAQAVAEARPTTPPRLIAVQVEGCAPLVEAFTGVRPDLGSDAASRRTLAEDLRVPRPANAEALLDLLRSSGGEALSASEAALIAAVRRAASADGILLGPEGGAGLAGLIALRERGDLAGARVVLVNPTALHRSPETLAAASVG